jgi:hypothetical protein
MSTTITVGDQLFAKNEEIKKLRKALQRIRDFPVHSEPVGGACAMQNIATDALLGRDIPEAD